MTEALPAEFTLGADAGRGYLPLCRCHRKPGHETVARLKTASPSISSEPLCAHRKTTGSRWIFWIKNLPPTGTCTNAWIIASPPCEEPPAKPEDCAA